MEACTAPISSLALLSSLYRPCDTSALSSVAACFLPQDVPVPACPGCQQAQAILDMWCEQLIELSDGHSTVTASLTTQEARALPNVPGLFWRPAFLRLWS